MNTEMKKETSKEKHRSFKTGILVAVCGSRQNGVQWWLASKMARRDACLGVHVPSPFRLSPQGTDFSPSFPSQPSSKKSQMSSCEKPCREAHEELRSHSEGLPGATE